MKNTKNTILTTLATAIVIVLVILGIVGIGFLVVKSVVGFIFRFVIIFAVLCYKEYRKNHKKNF